MKKGLGYRSPYYAQAVAERPPLDFFEIVSENFAGVGGQPRAFLDKLRGLYPVSMHGVSLSIGSLDPFRPEYLNRLKELARWLEPEFVSDHLCWTRHQGKNSHDLLPVPRTEESLAHVIARVRQVQDVLKRTLFLENPSAYVSFVGDGIHEADFLTEICRRTGAGVLLDLNNILVGEFNLGFDAEDYLARLEAPVCYFHIAGHSDDGPVRVDTHSRAPLPRVYHLLALARHKWPDAKLLLEWDDEIPPLNQLIETVTKAADSAPSTTSLKSPAPHSVPVSKSLALPEIYGTFWSLIDSPEGAQVPKNFLSDAHPVQAADGASVYNSAYFLRIRDTLKSMLPKTFEQLGEHEFDDLVADYLHAHPPTSEDLLDVADHLSPFVSNSDVQLSKLIEREIAFEKTFVAADSEPTQTWDACAALPESAWEDVRFEFSSASRVTADSWVYRKGHQVNTIDLDQRDAQFLSDLHGGRPFFESGDRLGDLPRALSLLRSVFDAGVVTRMISRALSFFVALGFASTISAADRIDISVPHSENAVAFCYLSGSVKPVDGYGSPSSGRAVRLRFEGTRSVDGCLKAVREHCRVAYLEKKAQIEKLKGYFFFFVSPEERSDFTLNPADCSAVMPGPPKTVTH